MKRLCPLWRKASEGDRILLSDNRCGNRRALFRDKMLGFLICRELNFQRVDLTIHAFPLAV